MAKKKSKKGKKQASWQPPTPKQVNDDTPKNLTAHTPQNPKKRKALKAKRLQQEQKRIKTGDNVLGYTAEQIKNMSDIKVRSLAQNVSRLWDESAKKVLKEFQDSTYYSEVKPKRTSKRDYQIAYGYEPKTDSTGTPIPDKNRPFKPVTAAQINAAHGKQRTNLEKRQQRQYDAYERIKLSQEDNRLQQYQGVNWKQQKTGEMLGSKVHATTNVRDALGRNMLNEKLPIREVRKELANSIEKLKRLPTKDYLRSGGFKNLQNTYRQSLNNLGSKLGNEFSALTKKQQYLLLNRTGVAKLFRETFDYEKDRHGFYLNDAMASVNGEDSKRRAEFSALIEWAKRQ